MSDARVTSHRAMERAFDALEASCEAAVAAATAASDQRFEPPSPLAPTRDPLHATRRVVRLACMLKHAVAEYCIATKLPDIDPYYDDEDDYEDPFDDEDDLF